MLIFEEEERDKEWVGKKALTIITMCELLNYRLEMFPLVSSFRDTTILSLNMYKMRNDSDSISFKSPKSCIMDWNLKDLEFSPRSAADPLCHFSPCFFYPSHPLSVCVECSQLFGAWAL